MASCGAGGSTRYFYTGNQVGYLNHTGEYNFVAGGPPGSGISSGIVVPVFFPPPFSRAPWEAVDASLSQEMLDASFPFIELQWFADIYLDNALFRISDKNLYVEDVDGTPRFYEARAPRGPNISITTGEWLNPNFEVSDLTLKLNNRDGFFNKYLAQGTEYVSWTSSRVEVYVGFGEKRENYFKAFIGFVAAKQGITVSENEISIKCYDTLDADEIPIPAVTFSETTFPELQDGINGKAVPMVYGDWENDVGSYGEINAYCLNAQESDPSYYIFKISINSLKNIGDIYFHRGERTTGKPDGPIRLDPSYVVKNADDGEFTVSAGLPVLTEDVVVMDRTAAAPGSGLNVINSEAATNFNLKGVKIGDTVVKTKTSEQAEVVSVSNNQLLLTGGVTFADKDEYAIKTKNFWFKKGDKVTVLCTGKDLQRISVNRLSDAGLPDAQPIGLTVDLDGTYWFADNSTQTIYHLDMHNVPLLAIPYSAVSATLSVVTGLSVQTDRTLWILDGPNSRIIRYVLDDMVAGFTFTTLVIPGIAALLADPAGLTIDTGNLLYLVDNATGNFYVINPFSNPVPSLVYSWNRSAFDAGATETYDLSLDVNLLNLVVVDRQTKKFYRIDRTNGSLISQEPTTNVMDDDSFISGVSTAQDGSIFFMSRADNTLYNYNEDAGALYNPGYICKDILQSLAGKTFADFDLSWNQTCRENLATYKSRCYVDDKTNIVTFCSKLLGEFNTSLFVKFNKYALFHIHFDNFRTDGRVIREGDIGENSFKAAKEYNQIFNSAFAEFGKLPFSGSKSVSETYISPSGVAFAGREINRKFDLPHIYRREDINKVLPLYVRLASTEPEFVEFETSWRFLFTQNHQFYNINYYETPDCTTGIKKGGRRFEMVPCFVRKIELNLDRYTMKLKVWSLGTTQFGSYMPKGPFAGGENDAIVLSSLGTIGYVSPTGKITAASPTSVTLEDVSGQDAQTRTAPVVGLAWAVGYKVALVNASTMLVDAVATIDSVVGQVVNFVETLPFTPTISGQNAAGFFTGGHFLRHANYLDAAIDQKKYYSHFGFPSVGYPTSNAQEIEEQRAGLHNFSDDRVPYILFPKDYAP